MNFPSYTAPFDLPKCDRERLESLVKSGDYPRLVTNRFVIVLQSGSGLTPREIAKCLGITLTTVYFWRAAYLREGVTALIKVQRLKSRTMRLLPRSHTASFPLPKEDRERLEELSQSAHFPPSFVRRFAIVLQWSDGVKVNEIAKHLGTAIPTVYRWRTIYLRYGVPGLLYPHN